MGNIGKPHRLIYLASRSSTESVDDILPCLALLGLLLRPQETPVLQEGDWQFSCPAFGPPAALLRRLAGANNMPPALAGGTSG